MVVDLAGALGVTSLAAGRIRDWSVRNGLSWRHRARSARRSVVPSISLMGREALDRATGHHRRSITDVVAKMTADPRSAVVDGLRALVAAAGEMPGRRW